MANVLWIEDDSRPSLAQLAGPVYVKGHYNLDVANDVTVAVAMILERKYDALIIDIRLPAGDDPEWQKCYINGGSDKIEARLGLHLISSLLGAPNTKVHLANRPDWIRPHHMGIFSVENDMGVIDEIRRFGIEVFYQKTADLSDLILLTIIEDILRKQTKQH